MFLFPIKVVLWSKPSEVLSTTKMLNIQVATLDSQLVQSSGSQLRARGPPKGLQVDLRCRHIIHVFTFWTFLSSFDF